MIYRISIFGLVTGFTNLLIERLPIKGDYFTWENQEYIVTKVRFTLVKDLYSDDVGTKDISCFVERV